MISRFTFRRRSVDVLIAMAAVGAAAVVRMLLPLLVGSSSPTPPFLPLIPAVICVALYRGFYAGILSTAIAAMYAVYGRSPNIGDRVNPVSVSIFVIVGVIVTLLCYRTRQERRHADASESARRNADRQRAAILASMTDGYIALDRDWRFVFFNDQALQMMGCDEDLSGKNAWTVFSALIGTEVYTALQRAMVEREPASVEYRRPDNSTWLDLRGYPFGDGLAVSLRDITSRKSAEEERAMLLASERAARSEAQHASRMKDEFLANLSHELRTPLNAILGWSQLLVSGRLDAASVKRGAQTIERNARAQAQLIEDLLDMSRIISGKVRLERHPVLVADVCQSAVDSVKLQAEARGVRVEAKILAPDARVRADAGRLQQIVWNLLSNAIKFTPTAGTVTCEVDIAENAVLVRVIDTGQGIRAEFLQHVFERFRQADASTTREFGGMGLGLSIVKSLVELHDGTVAAHSEGEGKGATFTVALPLFVSSESSTGSSMPQAAVDEDICESDVLTNVRVLVVDDEADTRDVMRRVLEECQASVTVAGSAFEAMEALKCGVPDVIVSDISMPRQDGYELIRNIRALPAEAGGRVPAVALTALARPEDQQRALDEGFQLHVSKPVEAQQLTRAVARLIRNKPPTADGLMQIINVTVAASGNTGETITAKS